MYHLDNCLNCGDFWRANRSRHTCDKCVSGLCIILSMDPDEAERYDVHMGKYGVTQRPNAELTAGQSFDRNGRFLSTAGATQPVESFA